MGIITPVYNNIIIPTEVSSGALWGDTGKGEENYRKLDFLIEDVGIRKILNYRKMVEDHPFYVMGNMPVIINYVPFGGGNAGNVIYLKNGKKMLTHLLPPGTMHSPYVISVMGMDKNIHIGNLNTEVENAKKLGVDIVYGKNLFIDRYATIVTDQDQALDAVLSGQMDIRGTKKGNAPAIMGRALRNDKRVEYLLNLGDSGIQKTIRQGIRVKNALLKDYGQPTFDEADIFETLHKWRDLIGDETIVNWESDILYLANQNPEARLYVSATQGPELDNTHGTVGKNLAYGVSPGDIYKSSCLPVNGFRPGKWNIVDKLYGTRAGGGPFPGEYEGEKAAYFSDRKIEIGTTSKNIRRTGPHNQASLKKLINRIGRGDNVTVTLVKTDIMGEFMKEFGPQRPIVGFYDKKNGTVIDTMHVSFEHDLDRYKPVYGDEFFWEPIGDDTQAQMREKGWDATPKGLQRYLIYTARNIGAPIERVTFGPKFEDYAMKGLYEETIEPAGVK
jgi:adenylosuccinate synthase